MYGLFYGFYSQLNGFNASFAQLTTICPQDWV